MLKQILIGLLILAASLTAQARDFKQLAVYGIDYSYVELKQDVATDSVAQKLDTALKASGMLPQNAKIISVETAVYHDEKKTKKFLKTARKMIKKLGLTQTQSQKTDDVNVSIYTSPTRLVVLTSIDNFMVTLNSIVHTPATNP